MKWILSLILALSGIAQADQTFSDVLNEDGEIIGQVWTDGDYLDNCPDGGCTEVKPVVCMTYSNDCLAPIKCKLTVSALLAEPFTGFTKIVTDVRDEIVFYNQTAQVCFNFRKDVYNLWKLIDTSDPDIHCIGWTE